jgi:hypothetical protein
MRAYAVMVEENLNGFFRDPYIYLAFDVFVWNLEYNFSWQRKKKGREQSPLPLIQEFL